MKVLERVKTLLRHTPAHPQWLLGSQRPTSELKNLSGFVLDIGCGDRWAEKYMSDSIYLGVDYPVTAAMYRSQPDIFADASRLPIADASIDAVLCFEVLEHLREPECALAEIYRVLKPGGVLLMSIPFLYPIHDAPHDYQRLTEHGLLRDLAAAGFEVVTVKKRGHALRVAGVLSSLALVGGLMARRSWVKWVFVPLALVGVMVINLTVAALALLIPDWKAMGLGYEVIARRKLVDAPSGLDAGDAVLQQQG